MNKGPSTFAEERVSIADVLHEAEIEVDRLPVETRANVVAALDASRRAVAAAAIEVVKFWTAFDRQYHRDLMPHVMPTELGQVSINSASPGYAEDMRADRRKSIQVHGAARDASREGAAAIAAALGDAESLAFRCAYWRAALSREDGRRFEELQRTLEVCLAHDALDATTRTRLVADWQAIRGAWVENARTLVDRENRLALARMEGADREKPDRDVANARKTIRDLEELAVLAWILALDKDAAAVLHADGVPTWIQETLPRDAR